MLGNISKKKGDNGDFYTKPVIDKKLKDAETATKAYTDKAAADAKNDLYAEVGEKVGAVEETVKAKLDSTDTKLDTKVDKVSGKSLIDSGVADNLEYDTDKEEILIKVSEPSQGLRVKSTAFSESTKIESGSITIESDASGLGNSLTLIPFGGIMINTNNENADVRLVKTGETHRLSQKADKTDLAKKADKTDLANKVDKVNGKTLIDKTVADFLSDYYGALQVKCRIFADGAIESYSEIIARGDITAKDGHDVIAYVQKEAGGSVVVHKLSEKVDKSELDTKLDGAPGLLTSDGRITVLNTTDTNYYTTITPGNVQIGFTDTNSNFCMVNLNDLPNKVDRVDGKSLIDENVADRLSYDSTTTNIVVSSISRGIEARNFIGVNAGISETGLISGQHLTIETDGADNVPGVVGIEAKNGDVTANVCIDPDSGAHKLHKLSEKVNMADVGVLSALATTNKSSIVAAINELKAAIDELKGS